jgi:hypothetical protein
MSAATVWHEAGHLLVAVISGRTAGASVNVFAPACGYSPGDGTPESMRADLRITVAGPIAETMAPDEPALPDLSPDSIYPTSVEVQQDVRLVAEIENGDREPVKTDEQYADELARKINPDDPAGEIRLARELASRKLTIHARKLAVIAERLAAFGVLTGGDVAEILNEMEIAR